MTVSSINTKNSYNGDGSTTSFAYTFPIHTTAELKVIERAANGTETVKALTTHYAVVDNGSAGGQVNFGTAPASGVTVVLLRDTNLTQETDYVANDPFGAETHEAALDKLTLQIQEAQEELDRSIKLSRTNTMSNTEFTVGSTDRAGKMLGFDNSGELSVTQEIGSNRGNWSASTSYAVRDIVKDTSTNNIFMAKTAHTSSGSQPLTTNTDSAKWDLLVDAASATTSATNAAASETAAAASENAAATSETNAANSANTANTHKNDAQTAKTAAETARTAAQTAQTAAEAALDTFDDRFLGAKSSDPSVDNDGDALITGALFFDTTAEATKVYTGSAWQNAAVDTTGFITLSGTQTLTNKTLTTPVINDMSGTAVVTSGTSTSDNKVYSAKRVGEIFYGKDTVEEIQSGETWSAADNKVATTAAIDARIIDLVDDVGGFRPIPNQNSFPSTNPDINGNAGTIVSVQAATTALSPQSGTTLTLPNGRGTGTVSYTHLRAHET